MAGAPSERLVEHALALLVQSEMAPGRAARHAQLVLQHWSELCRANSAAAQEARRRWSAISAMAPELRAYFERAPAMPAKRGEGQRQRRNLLLSVAALLGTGLGAGQGLRWYLQQPLSMASYQTSTARQLKVGLNDGLDNGGGTRLDLAPLGEVRIALYRQRRRVRMARGEVRFDVAPDAARPFEI
jgi:transmembrane sensor